MKEDLIRLLETDIKVYETIQVALIINPQLYKKNGAEILRTMIFEHQKIIEKLKNDNVLLIGTEC